MTSALCARGTLSMRMSLMSRRMLKVVMMTRPAKRNVQMGSASAQRGSSCVRSDANQASATCSLKHQALFTGYVSTHQSSSECLKSLTSGSKLRATVCMKR